MGTKRVSPSDTTRFEFARKHILTQQKLEEKLTEARDAHFVWTHTHEDGTRFQHGWNLRKPRSPEEREQLRTLEAAVVDARTKLLLHENDGRDL